MGWFNIGESDIAKTLNDFRTDPLKKTGDIAKNAWEDSAGGKLLTNENNLFQQIYDGFNGKPKSATENLDINKLLQQLSQQQGQQTPVIGIDEKAINQLDPHERNKQRTLDILGSIR